MSKVTIRDVAEKCGVTPTVVSAVLNGAGRRCRCSAEKKALILKTAAELDYAPNLFARSMVTRRIPMVLLMIYLDPENIAYGSRYFAETVASASKALGEHGLEITLALFSSQEEQIARFNSMVRKGVAGGVLSSVIPGANEAFIRVLHESRLPYTLLGETEIPAVSVIPHVYSSEKNLILEAQKKYGAEKVFFHQAEAGQDVLFPYHAVPGYSRFHYKPVIPVPEITEDPRNMIISLGYEYYHHLQSRMKIASPLVNERRKFEFLIPKGVPRLIAEGDTDCIPDAAGLLVQWQLHGQEPECKNHYISLQCKTTLKW